MKVLGWNTHGVLPDIPRYVLIVAPHTSNWDLLFGGVTAFALKLDVYFMAKHQLFKWPFGPLMRWLGGMPIDRRASGDTVSHAIEMFNDYDRLVIAIPPEGTRSKVANWKTGFYYIAAGAGVPIVMGYLDYEKKTGGLGPIIHASGDIERDMIPIRNFYSEITGRYSDKASLAGVVKQTAAKKCS